MDEKFTKDHIFVVSVPTYDWAKIAKEKEEQKRKKEE